MQNMSHSEVAAYLDSLELSSGIVARPNLRTSVIPDTDLLGQEEGAVNGSAVQGFADDLKGLDKQDTLDSTELAQRASDKVVSNMVEELDIERLSDSEKIKLQSETQEGWYDLEI